MSTAVRGKQKSERLDFLDTGKQIESITYILTVLWNTTLWPFPKLSICAERLKQMARCLIASSVCASKKSWGLAEKKEKGSLVFNTCKHSNTFKPVNRSEVSLVNQLSLCQ